MAPKHFEGRQEGSTPTIKIMSHSQPTAVIPLTTTFVPPATCTVGLLTMLPPPYYLIWANEPFPVANETHKGCYPPEFMASYKSVPSGTVGSSIVPAMSPIVCPKSYCPVLGGNNNYLACCPSGYKFTEPKTLVDPKRPAYGGTCYSELTVSSTHTIVAYDTAGLSRTQPFIASVTDTHAYAHPIDGFAAQPPRMQCEGDSSSSSSSPSSFSSTPLSPSTSTSAAPPPPAGPPPRTTSSIYVSPGGIAGATIGGVVGLIGLITLIFLLLRSRKSRKQGKLNELSETNYGSNSQYSHSTISSPIVEKGNSQYEEVYEMRGVIQQPEPVYEVEAPEKGFRGFDRVHEMNADSERLAPHEVEANEKGVRSVDTKK